MTINLLLICGSLRLGSINEAVLQTAAETAPADVTVTRYRGLADLPHFNPDDDHDPLHPAVAELRAQLGAADAILYCTPEYAGALPGSFKNLLDWTVGGGQTYGQPAAWINASWAATGAAGAHASLKSVLTYTGVDIVASACRQIAVTRPDVTDDGSVGPEQLRGQIADAVLTLIDYLRTRPAG